MNRIFSLALASTLLVSLSSLAGCTTEENQRDDETYAGCTIEPNNEHSSVIRCADGTEAIIPHGKDGEKGEPGESGAGDEGCTLSDNDNGTQTLTCGDNSIVLGHDCTDGFPGNVDLGSSDMSSNSLVLMKIMGCTKIQGDLRYYYDDTELDPYLQKITHVGGSVEFYEARLENLELPNLQHVGGTIRFEYTDLKNISFPALDQLGESLEFYHNAELATLNFSSLETIEGDLTVWGNSGLLNLQGFTALKTINGNLTITGNELLEDGSGISGLTHIEGNVTIHENPSLDGCSLIQHIEQLPGFGHNERDDEKLVTDASDC